MNRVRISNKKSLKVFRLKFRKSRSKLREFLFLPMLEARLLIVEYWTRYILLMEVVREVE